MLTDGHKSGVCFNSRHNRLAFLTTDTTGYCAQWQTQQVGVLQYQAQQVGVFNDRHNRLLCSLTDTTAECASIAGTTGCCFNNRFLFLLYDRPNRLVFSMTRLWFTQLCLWQWDISVENSWFGKANLPWGQCNVEKRNNCVCTSFYRFSTQQFVM